MRLNYTVDYDKMAKANFSDIDIPSSLLRSFQGTYRAALYIFKEVFDIGTLEVSFGEQDVYYNFVLSVVLIIKTRIGNFNLILEDHRFRICNGEGTWTFKLNYFYPNDELYLEEYVKYEKNRLLAQRFSSHKMEIEIHFINTGRVLYLDVPLVKPFFLDLMYLNRLKEGVSLNNIIKYYRTMFLERQSDYDKRSSNTIIRTYQKIDNYSDFDNKGIKLDELTLKSGFVQYYELGNIYFDKDNNPIIITLKDGTYIIGNYSSKKSSLNINESIALLEKRKRELN